MDPLTAPGEIKRPHGCLGIFTLDGNIGSGKTTLLRAIGNERTITFDSDRIIQVFVLEEPVDQWTEPLTDGKTPLDLMYEGIESSAKKQQCFDFQIFALETRTSSLMKNLIQFSHEAKHPFIIIAERAIWADKYIFFAQLQKLDFFSAFQIQIYERLWNLFNSITCSSSLCRGAIFLTSDLSTITERIRKRDRISERHIEPYYLADLETTHLDLAALLEKQGVNVKIINPRRFQDMNTMIVCIFDFIQSSFK
jgi:deoxyadenosine/deoxycytidine kinase